MPATAVGTRFILNEFAILMRHEKCVFKNWTLHNTLVVSTKIGVKKFEIINFLKEITFILQNI